MDEADRASLDLRRRYEDEARTVWRYDSASFWDGRYHRRRFSLISDRLRSILADARQFLDVGCGSGEYLALAKQLSVPYVLGSDLSIGYCRRAWKLSSADAVIQASADRLPLVSSSVDVVLCSEVLEHLSEVQCARAVEELCRVARRAVMITTPNRAAAIRSLARRLRPDRVEQMDAEVGHINLLSFDEWSRIVGSLSGWRVTSLETAHVLPPVVGEHLHLPPVLAPIVDRIEQYATHRSSRSGNCLLIVLAPNQMQDGAP